MKPEAWLTIDDSPSADTDALTDYLLQKNVPALLFCRGDRLMKDPDAVMRAIEKGFVIGNHAFSHTRASVLGFKDMTVEIERTDALIDAAYRRAAVPRPGKYFRFPHMDRGAGGWIVDYNAVPAHTETLKRVFGDGLNIDLTPPGDELRALKIQLQLWLRAEGFTPPPTAGVTLPWFAQTEMARAIDAMFTFSTSDWMVTPRHQGQWPYKTVEDLERKIDDDPWLHDASSRHIILTHDQDGMLDVTKALIERLQDTVNFIAF